MTYPIVLLHGWASVPAVWQPLIEYLAPYKVLNLNLPAYGNDSAKPDIWQNDLISYVANQLPAKCHLVGWSLGGNIAVELAHQYPDKIASLSTIATVPAFIANDDWPWAVKPAVFDLFANGVAAKPVATLKRFAALQAKGSTAEKNITKALRELIDSQPEQALAESLAWLGRCKQHELWQQLGVPRLHIFGDGDALIPIEAAKYCQPSKVLANAGHAPMLSQPHALAATLKPFLEANT